MNLSTHTIERLGDVLADAVAYSSYWCAEAHIDGNKKPISEYDGEYLETEWLNAMLQDNAKLIITTEDDDEEHEITLQSLSKAYHEHLKENPDEDYWDASDADCIFQSAALGEVVYG